MGSSHGQPNVLASIWSALRRIDYLAVAEVLGMLLGTGTYMAHVPHPIFTWMGAPCLRRRRAS